MKLFKYYKVSVFILAISLMVGCSNAESTSTDATAAEQPVKTASESELEKMFGPELINLAGEKVPVSELEGKTLGILFTAHWCPPCRAFSPVLVDVYNSLMKDGAEFEIIQVSADRNAGEMQAYMKDIKMPWLALSFGNAKIQALNQRYKVRGIPTFIIIDAKGKTITTDGRSDVIKSGKQAFSDWTSKNK
ncbi:MAG: redoxin domain-containing protein [Lentisphaerae bacterium]|nr:redoxin domain-containing protein [Lentisphaerota bacterium]